MRRRKSFYYGALMLIAFLGTPVLGTSLQQKSENSSGMSRTGKPRVAVFAKAAVKDNWAIDMTSGAIEDKLADNGFSLVQRKDLDTVLGELELTVNALFDSKEGAKLGKQVAAKYLVLGKIQEINKKNILGPLRVPVPGRPSSYEASVQMQLVNCETSDILFTKTYKEKSSNKIEYDPNAANGERNTAYLQALALILDKFVADTQELTQTGPLKSQAGSSSVLTGALAGAGNAEKKSKEEAPGKPAAPKPAMPVAETVAVTPAPQAAAHGKVVDVDGQIIFLEINSARVGQILEVYVKRRAVNNEKGELLSYYYNSADKCARVRVTEVLSGNSAVAAIEQTFAPGGAADPKPRADRVAKLHVAKVTN